MLNKSANTITVKYVSL